MSEFAQIMMWMIAGVIFIVVVFSKPPRELTRKERREMKRKAGIVIALIIVGGLLCGPAVIWAGDKEDYQGKLDKLVQDKTISALTFENLSLRTQQAKDKDERIGEALSTLVKELQDKGFIIKQMANGAFEVIAKPSEKKEEAKPK